jgi:hypothetical protein
MLFRFACKRYRSIEDAREIATRAQLEFVADHAAKCGKCRVYSEVAGALRAGLGKAELAPVVISGDFTERVVRGVQAMRRESYRTSYRPVLVGAMAAFVALGAILQVVGAQPEAPSTDGTAESTLKRESPLDSSEPGDLNLFDTPSKLVRDPRPHDV